MSCPLVDLSGLPVAHREREDRRLIDLSIAEGSRGPGLPVFRIEKGVPALADRILCWQLFGFMKQPIAP